MKLKTLAAAAALLCGSTAFAGINTFDGDAELFLLVWDEGKATYALDTGFTLGELTTGAVQTFSVANSDNFAAFAKEDGDLNDFTQFAGTRWALFAVDNNNNFNFDGKDLNYLSTTTGDAKMPADTVRVNTALESMADYTLTLGNNGLTLDPKVNGDLWAKVGSPAHFIESSYGGGAGIFAGNAIGGGIQKLNLCTYDLGMDIPSCVTSTAAAAARSFNFNSSAGLNLEAAFDGNSLTVTAVPEPGTYALLLAGLATVGFMARRRKA
jgi:PEP-CTERM motif